MQLDFVLIGAVTLLSAVAAMSLRHLIHCALCLVLTFAGLAALFLKLDAQFVGFAQILVYVGAVAMLILFAILLTRSGESPKQAIVSSSWLVGVGVAVLVFGVLGKVIVSSSVTHRTLPVPPEVTVKKVGDQLMTNFVLPLEVIALLLTAALIGAVIIAMQEKEPKP